MTVPFALLLSPQFVAADTIKLTHNDHNPPFSPPGKANIYFGKKVNELAKGKMEMTVQSGGALLGAEEVYRGVQTNVCDSGMYVIDAREGFKLNLVMSLPFMGWPADQEPVKIYKQLLSEFKPMRDEWKGVTVIGVMMMPPTGIHTVKKPVRTPADLKGMKIMGSEFMLNATMQAAGATPVQLDIGDMAPSLNTGLIEGIMNHLPVVNVFGALPITKYHTVFGKSGITITPAYIIMNTNRLNGLPADMHKVIIDAGHMWEKHFTELSHEDIVMSEKKANELHQTFINLSPAEIEVWYNLVKKPVHEKWIKDCEDAGLPGRAVYNRALELAREYK